MLLAIFQQVNRALQVVLYELAAAGFSIYALFTQRLQRRFIAIQP